MKRLLLVLAGIVALGADWPQKGDTVYVSAKLTGVGIAEVVIWGLGGGKMPDVPPLDACAPLTIKSRSDEGDHFSARDDANQTRILLGPWAVRMHRSEAECRAALEALGPARVQSKGVRYTIVPPHVEAQH